MPTTSPRLSEQPTPTALVRPERGTKHWFYSELDNYWRVFTWDGNIGMWVVPGFTEPQKPRDMVEEWSFYYVAPVTNDANDGDNPPRKVFEAFDRLYRAGLIT